MSRFLKYVLSASIIAIMLGMVSGCCELSINQQQYIEFMIVDGNGENVLSNSSLPPNIIWYYPTTSYTTDRRNPTTDLDRGVFIMEISDQKNYNVDIIEQSFIALELSFKMVEEDCGSYKQLSGVKINGVAWDYATSPTLVFVYDP